MSAPYVFSRRRFLQQAGAFSALSLASSIDKLGLASAAAQAPGYKALVCVFLFGGNDSNNMVLPFTNYAAYNAVRGPATGINIPQTGAGAMLQITPTNTPGVVYGLHPSLGGGMQTLFQTNRKLAIIANAGTLVEPITRAEYRANPRVKKVPENLFSHSDQQQQYMSSITQASTLQGVTGWAGRLADKVVGMNSVGATPMSMSFSGAQVFGNGVSVKTLALPTAGNFGFSGDAASNPTAQQIARTNARTAISTALEANQMIAAAQGTAKIAIDSSVKLNPIIQGVAPMPQDPAITAAFNGLVTGIANQLKAVARVIQYRSTLGHAREIFFVSVGGYDTHTVQLTGHQALYSQLGPALAAFYNATVGINVADSVTTFTMTDFSRTWKPNGGGTDHAWGGHHFVLGGAVQGGQMFGQFPDLQLGSASVDDSGTEGRWIPRVSIEQYGATLGKWFGVSPVDLAQVFPNLYRFPTADLGFMA
jgi:uncharacterized protein (DUF1501 family)